MESKVEQEEVFNWKRVQSTVQLAFEEHPHSNSITEDNDTKNHDFHSLKKAEHDADVPDSAIAVSHQEGSKQIFEVDNTIVQPRIIASLEGSFDKDLANNVHLTFEKASIPTIRVKISPEQISAFEEASAGRDWKLVVEIMFGEKSHSAQSEKYKIFKNGIAGSYAKRYCKNNEIQFKNLRTNYHTTVDKNSKLVIVLYYLGEGKRKTFRQMLLSKDLFIVEENKIMAVDNEEALKLYFDLFGSEFMDKLPNPVKINKSDKHALHEEINKLESYLLKRNKRFLNVVFLSFKFPHFCELYFKSPEQPNENEIYDQFCLKRNALSTCLSDAVKAIDELKLQNPGELLCNYTNPNANLIFRVNINLRKVRIFVRKQFTEILNIIVSEDYVVPEGFVKFESAKELKDFYLEYYSYARKCKSSESYSRPVTNALSASQHPKKVHRKVDDDEYHEEQNQDEMDSQVDESHQGGSLKSNLEFAEKKPKKHNVLLKKLYANNQPKKIPAVSTSPRQSKYPTRVKTRAQQYLDSSNNQDRKAKKNKQKQLGKKPQTNVPMMPPNMNMGMPSFMNQMGTPSMPFQMFSGGAPQSGSVSTGMFPLLQNSQKKDGNQSGSGQQKGPQMAGMPMGMQGMQGMQGMPFLGGFPGMGMSANGMMMPNFGGMQMPMGQGQPGQKKDGKDGKQESSSGTKNGMPMFLPMQGGGGMGMPMMGNFGGSPFCVVSPNGQSMHPGQFGMGMPQMMGMQGGAGGMGGMAAIQGPNGQIFMMPLMGQNIPSGQQNSSQPSQNSSSTGNSSSSGQGQGAMAGMQGMPMGFMMGNQGGQGQGGMQGMMLPQNMMSMMNPQMGMMGPGQPGSGTSQFPVMNLGQFSSGGMGFMMPNQSNQKNDKQSNTDPSKPAEAPKKSENNNSNRKEDSGPSHLDQNQSSNGSKHPNTGGLPSFLSSGSAGQFTAFPSNQPKEGDKQNGQKNSTGPGPGFPPNLSMMNGGMLTPQMIQQFGQGGSFAMGSMGQGGQQSSQQGGQQSAQGGSQTNGQQGMPSGMPVMGMPQGMPMGQGMSMPQNMIPPEVLNNMTPQQKQMLMMQYGKIGMPMPGSMGGKKEEDKK